MAGTLLVSLDCEGKWGFADDPKILADTRISNASLVEAYDFLLRLFAKDDLRVTFAVVGLFVAGRELAETYIRDAHDDDVLRQWLRVPDTAMMSNDTEGWFFEALPVKVFSAGQHELASHGYSHLPFGYPAISESIARRELHAMHELSRERGWEIESMVFPRNVVAHEAVLGEYGIRRYRRSTEAVSLSERLQALAGEFRTNVESDPVVAGENWVSAGQFLNWRSGVRRLVPSAITVSRWRSILTHAVETSGCAHVWFHPHNLVTGHRQRELVTEVLSCAGELVRRGDLVSRTFREVA
ncbi:MAG: hypothetical protein EBX19_05755 [Actinobacteria bacterium]|nr:hypothetical protein [Actinomycetota bacterium]